MTKSVRFLGMDVHAETSATAQLIEVRSVGKTGNSEEGIAKKIRKLGGPRGLKACYEAVRAGTRCTAKCGS